MRVNVIMNRRALAQLSQIQHRALEMTAEAVKTDIVTSAVVPKQTGELERSAFVEVEKKVAKIIFDTPYARRLYWHPEYDFRTDKNANARGKWMEAYHSGDKQKWVRDAYKKFLKQAARGLIQ